MSKPFDVCFVGLKCYDVLAGKPVPKYLGGIERVFVALAQSLSAGGIRVAFVTYDEGQAEVEVHEGITVFKAHDANAGIPILRSVHPRMTAIWRAMRRANARYYLQMGAGIETLAVAIGTRGLVRRGARFLYCAASNLDCEKDLLGIPSASERVLYARGLRMSHSVIAQTERQAAMLRENFGLASEVIPMPFEAPAAGDIHGNGTAQNPGSSRTMSPDESVDILWVGRTVPVKRLEWLLELAELMPEAVFHVAGTANEDSAYSADLVSRARGLANVRIHGRLSQADLLAHYRRAFVLCCTSSLEGFPTTFLEAWKLGVPVVTTFDPDGIVARTEVGVAAATVPEMQEAILRLHRNPGLYERMSRNAEELYGSRYSPQAVTRQYLEILC